jgi:hypothetical protein
MLPNISREVFTVTNTTYGSSRNGDDMYTIELTDIVNGDVYETYVVTDHKNYEHWQRIVENPDRFYFLINLKLKEIKRGPNTGKYYVDGDSRVEIAHETSDHTRFETLIYQMRGEALPVYLRKDLFDV